MNRIIKKNIWANQREADELRSKAQAACLTEAEFIRKLIKGYVPPQVPDDRFFQAMDIVDKMADAVNAVAVKMNSSADMIALMTEARKWSRLRNLIEKEFLRPKEVRPDGGDEDLADPGQGG